MTPTVGQVFSESSHFKITKVDGSVLEMEHFESNSPIKISLDYIQNYMKSADYFEREEKVGKEDKLWTEKQLQIAKENGDFLKDGFIPKVGDVRVRGIRSIWDNINNAQAFTVCFKKADKVKTKKTIQEEHDNQRKQALNMIDNALKLKKSRVEAFESALTYIQLNPITQYIEGEDRVLRGFKIQFNSRDGKYDCIDMDIIKTEKESGIRPVNINTISYLIYDNVKYIVE